MRVVILAGGLGTRLAEETDLRPKPMIEIGDKPILWHIMKNYSAAGLSHFVVALGFKGQVIKRFFLEYQQLASDLTIETGSGRVQTRQVTRDDWVVDLVDTGLATNTGGRVRRLADWLPDDHFCLTYGDGLADLDLPELLRFHQAHGRMATVTAVRPPARYGGLIIDGEAVREFTEKPQIGEGWINGGFLVLRRDVIDRVAGDDSSLERDVLEDLALEGQLMAYRHEGFWQSMDTLREVRLLRSMWESGEAPWKTWR